MEGSKTGGAWVDGAGEGRWRGCMGGDGAGGSETGDAWVRGGGDGAGE